MSPVRRSPIVGCLTLVLVLVSAACGDDSDDDDDTVTTGDPPSDLADVAVQPDELPTGYAPQASGDPSDSSDAYCDGKDPSAEVPSEEEVEVLFLGGELGPVVVNIVAEYSDEEEAQAFMVASLAAINDCGSYTDEGGNEVTLSPEPFPSLGDETFAARSRLVGEFGDIELDLIFVRVGDRVPLLSQGGSDGVDSELVEELARLVAERL